jgi:GT2 family glycosyltransferase
MLSIVIPTRRDDLQECLDSIDRHTDNYEVILVKGKKGLAKKINEGIARATGEYIILLHDDSIVTSGWAEELAEVGAFKVGEMNDKFEHWGGLNGDYCKNINFNPDYSSFLCLSKQAVEKIGKFDEWYEEPHCLDVEMGLQIRSKGFKIKCLPGKIIHRHSVGAGVAVPKQEKYLKKKWPEVRL